MENAAPLTLYSERVEAFVAGCLAPYLARLRELSVGSIKAKEFNDAVWGTIALDSAEVVVLDSPMLQRLRRIRQLGVAQLVYPGANHTRLEHSIGVAHQVDRLISAVSNHAGEPHFGSLGDIWQQSLRMAALCHDVGHGLMSHVVENALRSNENCENLILAFQRQMGKDTASQLSEMAAYYMVRSDPFREMLAHALRIGGRPADPDLADRISDCIIGQSNDSDFPLIHEAISGPFDCDKLDYMTRDAMMCGVPVVTDVTRLTQKIRAVSLATADLPEGIAGAVNETGRPHTIVAVARSGASTLHEVSLGRSLMHDKIYRHHKVRATEAMVAAVVSQIGVVLDEYSPLIPLSIYDDQFLSLDADRINGLIASSGRAVPEVAVAVAADLAGRIRERDLFVRAFAFSQKMPADPYKDDPAQRSAIELLIRDTDDGESRAEITHAIVAQVRAMLEALDRPSYLETLFPGGDPFPYIRIDPPIVKKTTTTDTDQSRTYLIDHDHRLISMGVVSAETRGWADAYINTRDVGFVFCPRELSALVHLATEVVFRVDRGVHVTPAMHSYAKAGTENSDELRDELFKAGYYTNLPRDLRPLPEFLRKAGTTVRIRTAATRLAGYMGPVRGQEPERLRGGSVSEERVRDWVAQFDDPELALVLVENIHLIDRFDVANAIRTFLNGHSGQFSRPAFVPIGQAKDGSTILTYYSGDIAGEFDASVLSLPEAITSGRPLVFVDDFIGRGSSITSVFQAMFGASVTENLDEERPPALSGDVLDLLRSRPIGIVTAAGTPGGRDYIKSRLTELGISPLVSSLRDTEQIPTIFSALDKFPSDRVDDFQEALLEVGKLLIHDSDSDKTDSRALGYGNEGLLLISPFNTPTMTLTALWRTGNDALTWRPLFPRRPKH